MTIRQAYEYVLIELNKVKAPSLLLADFIYFWNKATQQYTNLEYNTYNINQQKSDNLTSLMKSAIISATDISSIGNTYNNSVLHNGTFVVNLPTDYYHLLNCLIEFTPQTPTNKCVGSSENVFYGAKRLTEDMSPTVLRNYYFRPSVKNPYYYIHTVDKPVFNVSDRNTSPSSDGYRMEIRFGNDISKFKIQNIFIDYMRTPTFVEIDQDTLDELDDNSEILEFSDYICQEIINRCCMLVLENGSNPRMNTNIPISQTIASSSQQSK